MEKYFFLYCQKIVVFSKDHTKVLLCKRQGEADYDSLFSFIGGKMERTDESILAGLTREKNEEVGLSFKIKIMLDLSINEHFVRKDGNPMILPHYFAEHEGGEIVLSDEYSEYKWVSLAELEDFQPKIPNIFSITTQLLEISKNNPNKKMVKI